MKIYVNGYEKDDVTLHANAIETTTNYQDFDAALDEMGAVIDYFDFFMEDVPSRWGFSKDPMYILDSTVGRYSVRHGMDPDVNRDYTGVEIKIGDSWEECTVLFEAGTYTAQCFGSDIGFWKIHLCDLPEVFQAVKAFSHRRKFAFVQRDWDDEDIDW